MWFLCAYEFTEHMCTCMFSFPLSSTVPRYKAGVCFSAEVSCLFNAFSVSPPEGTLQTVLEQMRLFLKLPILVFARSISIPYS